MWWPDSPEFAATKYMAVEMRNLLVGVRTTIGHHTI